MCIAQLGVGTLLSLLSEKIRSSSRLLCASVARCPSTTISGEPCFKQSTSDTIANSRDRKTLALPSFECVVCSLTMPAL